MAERAVFPDETDFIPTDLSAPYKLYTAGADPDVIVRFHAMTRYGNAEQAVQAGEYMASALKVLEGTYGVAVVPHGSFVAQGPANTSYEYSQGLYTAARMVHGTPLLSITKTTQGHTEWNVSEGINFGAFHDPIEKLSRYYATESQQKNTLILDLDGRQLRYGTVAGNDTPASYLIDLDLRAVEYDPDAPTTQLAWDYYNGLTNLAYDALIGQDEFGEQFGDVRDNLARAEEHISMSDIQAIARLQYGNRLPPTLPQLLEMIR